MQNFCYTSFSYNILRGSPGSLGGRWPTKTPPRDPCKRTRKTSVVHLGASKSQLVATVVIYIYIRYTVHLEYAFFQLCSTWTRTQLHLEYAPISCSFVFSPFGLRSGSLCTSLCSLFLLFFQAVFTGCLVTKSKTGRVSKLTDFLLLCVLKSIFFYRKGSPPRMVEIHGKWSRLSNTDSNHFGKLGCKRTCIEYGSDTGFHQRKREVPLFKSYSRKQNSRMRKNKKTTWCLVTKIKNWQGLQIDRFLITLCTKK